MTVLDKVIAAVTPADTDEDKMQAREKASHQAGPSGWFRAVIDHHEQIERAFASVKNASSAATRKSAQKWLGIILTGHSIAEEAVLYPAMAMTNQKRHAGEMYTEQSAAKMEMGALDELDPMSQDYLDKLEHIRGAVAHHVKEEEGEYFLELHQNAGPALNSKLTSRYAEEFARYMGDDQKAA